MGIGEKLISKIEFESWIKILEKRLKALEAKDVELEGGVTQTITVITDLDLDASGHVLSYSTSTIKIKNGRIVKIE